MIQDIGPKVFNNQFQNKGARPQDLFLAYNDDAVLVKEDEDRLWYPSFADSQEVFPHMATSAQYLFSIDNLDYFLVNEGGLDGVEGWNYVSVGRFRSEKKFWRSFAGVVGWQLSRWYESHRYCSKCSQPLCHSQEERMLFCPACGFGVYPTISPCVIVAVHNRNRLLLARSLGRPRGRYGLVAGFAEVGESMEQTVRREVMEEVGLKVKNLKFYKSQPWPFSDSLLMGFFAELDGRDDITLQESELSEALWLEREDIPPAEVLLSLTSEMIEVFRTGAIEL